MATYNSFKVAFRNFVITDPTVTALIGTRFYGAFLASLKDPVFPNATFYPDPGTDFAGGIVNDFNLNISAHTDTTFDDAAVIFDTIRTSLKNQLISSILTSVGMRTTPVEHYDELSRIYTVTAKFRIIRFS